MLLASTTLPSPARPSAPVSQPPPPPYGYYWGAPIHGVSLNPQTVNFFPGATYNPTFTATAPGACVPCSNPAASCPFGQCYAGCGNLTAGTCQPCTNTLPGNDEWPSNGILVPNGCGVSSCPFTCSVGQYMSGCSSVPRRAATLPGFRLPWPASQAVRGRARGQANATASTRLPAPAGPRHWTVTRTHWQAGRYRSVPRPALGPGSHCAYHDLHDDERLGGRPAPLAVPSCQCMARISQGTT